MNKLSALILLVLLVGCSSAPHKRLMTVEEKLDDSNGEITDGMARTPNGAVIDITVKEVQAQKKELQDELAKRDQRIRYLEERNRELETQLKVQRVQMGLTPDGTRPALRVPASVDEPVPVSPSVVDSHTEEYH